MKATEDAAGAGALVAPSLIVLGETGARALAQSCAPVARRLPAWIRRVLRPLRLARAAGESPTGRERLRLQLVTSLAGFVIGLGLGGAGIGIVLAVASFWLAPRLLDWHRSRYRARLDAGASAAAVALADALDAGHSVRGALLASGTSLGGSIGAELRAVGRELELGGETGRALERLRLRACSRRVDLIVAAVRVQRRSGGSLATLLRGIAATLDDQDRLEGEARAATAQARFTAVVVVLLPLAGLLLAELAAPGIVGRMTGSPVAVWLLFSAALLQLSGFVVIRRLTRVEC